MGVYYKRRKGTIVAVTVVEALHCAWNDRDRMPGWLRHANDTGQVDFTPTKAVFEGYPVASRGDWLVYEYGVGVYPVPEKLFPLMFELQEG